jgi:hypothetical protein
MITAETVNGIVRFQANGQPVVSLYCRVEPGASQPEVRARVDSLLDQIRPLAKDRALDHRYRLSVRADIERIKDALGSGRWRPGTVAVFSCSGRGLSRRYRCRARCVSRSWWTPPAGPSHACGARRVQPRVRPGHQPGGGPGVGDVPGRDERAANYLVC